ncbi:E3 ubiquitin-protein ligase rnf213-alpha [Acropora cervicornis]|uniref:E3 ubiquitin-protein ligase rnf213-alpha n=1 Tax=Acropora cervicornis TaxID=6130 RepID=A0AAD9UZH5_ACRCE|nr:E3 ubiquitin-protein ligase rnf213-alpha [Acropora cervicornis]
MKCTNPECSFSLIEKLDDSANFCSKCGRDLRRSEEASPSQSEKTTLFSKNSAQVASEAEDRHCSALDETKKLKKRKGEEADENPAKRKSCGPGDLPDQLVHADPPALENFADEKKPEEPLLDQPQGGQLASQCCSGTSNPEDSPEEDTNVQSQPEGNSEDDNKNLTAQKTMCPVEESPNLEIEKSHGEETSKNEADLPDTSPSSKDAKVEFDAKDDKNTADTTCTESKQSAGGIENPSESDSDDGGEGGQKEGNSDTRSCKPQPNASKRKVDERKKKERKNRRMQQKQEEAGKRMQGDRDKDQKTKNKEIVADGMHPLNQNARKEQKGSDDAQEKNASGYFRNHRGSTLTIVFHAVLSPHFKFDQGHGDRIFMRFGGAMFGFFNEDVVEVFQEQELESGFILIKASLSVPCNYVSRKVPYKYIVQKKAMKNSKEKRKDVWEHLVNWGHERNRCLQIPTERNARGAVWHQYDDAVFPSASWFQNIRNKIPFLKSMDPVEGRNIATWAMLPRWRGFLSETEDTNMSAWDAVLAIRDLAYCMTQTLMEEGGRVYDNVPAYYSFTKILREWLTAKIKKNALPVPPGKDNRSKEIDCLVSSLAITHVLVSNKVHLDFDDYVNLLSSLILRRDPDKESCSALQKLLALFPSEQHQLFGDSLQRLCRQVAKEYRDAHDWLFAVPLAHFLTQASKPFDKAVLLMGEPKAKEEIWWGAEGFDTKSVRKRTFGKNSGPSSLLNLMPPLFELDPLCRRTFLLANPCEAFGEIASSGKFPPVEIYTTLARILSEKSSITTDVSEAVALSLKVTRENGKTTVEVGEKELTDADEGAILIEEADLCVTSCLRILKSVTESRNKFDLVLECLKSIEACVSLLQDRAMLDKENKRPVEKMKHMVAESFQVSIKWCKEYLYKHFFPCYIMDDTEKELQIWSELLSLEWQVKECDEIWRDRVSQTLKRRLEEPTCKDLVKVFTKANMANQHKRVKDLVSEVTFGKVEHILQSGKADEELFYDLSEHGLGSAQSLKCSDLLTMILTRSWPASQGGLSSSRRGSDYVRVLKPDGQEILVMALSSLEDAVRTMKDGTIQYQLLMLISHNLDRFLELSQEIIKEGTKDAELRQNLDQRLVELSAFEVARDQVVGLIEMCNLIKGVDVGLLSKRSEMDVSCLAVGDLVRSSFVKEKVYPKVSFFQLSPKAKVMMASLSKLRDSEFLRRFWKENGKRALDRVEEKRENKGLLSVDDVEELVWTPSKQELDSFVERFMSGTMSFEEVDKYFKVLCEKRCIAKEINLITSGTVSLINQRIGQIEQYYELEKYVDAARSILEFKDSVGLEGNFQLVEDLKDQMNKEFKRRQLRSMNEALQLTGQALSKITPERKRCLDAVARCQPLIAWLKGTISGPQELKVLVDLAIISAGETDIETARITCLHTSCLGFAPLIFDLEPSFGFNELMTKCDPVWSAVDTDPTLPDKLKIATNALSKRSQFIFKHLKMYNESRSHSYCAVCELDIAARALDIALGNHALRAQPTDYSLICRPSLVSNVESNVLDMTNLRCEIEKELSMVAQRAGSEEIDTNRHLDWLKGIETSHGSVAKSSLLDAQAINQKGVYRIGYISEDESAARDRLTLEKVVELGVPLGESGESKYYSLDDLKDLQSKLMLIAAKASHGKEEVDQFTNIFQSVLRLGEAYISLCKAGEVNHLKWKFEFECKVQLTGGASLTSELTSQSDKMERHLQEWKHELHQKRLQYKELNHYTTMQLLCLRRDLADLRGRGPRAVDGISLEVYNLLESALPGVEPDILKTVLVSCGVCSQETGQSILRSFGGGCAIQQSAFAKQPVSVKNIQSSQEEMFQSLVAHLESIDSYSDPEEIAIAAMMSCKGGSEAELIVWCVKNGNKDDVIRSKYSEALDDPMYCALIDKDASVSIEGESPYEKESSMETDQLPQSVETTFILDQTADGEFLSLDDLGKVLTHLASLGPKKRKRRPPKYLIPGKPNFVVVPKDDIFGTVLSLYMHDNTQSLPSSEEVVICTSDTTAEEIELLWRRSLGNHDGGLFCLVNVDLLDYSVSQKAADTLSFLLQESWYNRNEDLCLVIFCSSENEDRAHMAAALDQYRLGTMPHTASPKEIRQYLKAQFKACPQKQGRFRDQNLPWTSAGTVDKEKVSVRVFSSERAGSGKTLAVHRLHQNVRQLTNNDVVIRYLDDTDTDVQLCIAIPIYGPEVKQSSVVESFLPHMVAPDLPLSRIFHLDVHPSVTSGLDTLLFNLLVLGVLRSSSGQVWRRRASDLYVIELTTGQEQGSIGTNKKEVSLFKASSLEKNMRSKKRLSEPFHALLPTIYCGTPEQALLELKRNAKESLNPRFDDGEFRSQHVQRAFQYLKLWETAKENLDHFWFVPNHMMGDYAECLEILVSNCGIRNPSWAELRHFVNFLNSQLQSCEESTFCNMEHVGDTLEGFRSFVVNFMILMSRDFATPSLESTELPLDTDHEDEEEPVETAVTQFCLRRHWETSSHPYIFFNQDRVSMTFVGFHIDQNGNLIDPNRGVVIQPNLMSRHLRTGLTVQFQFGGQRMGFETNYETWSKGEKIEKLCGVMGVEWPYDPDNSYELTTDNLMKILAIHMRFRCGIPVVIMGETGCGKTCLIRYMCGLQSGPGGPKNMLLMKIHGGTTYEDIAKKVEKAEAMAAQNEGLNIDTVLFFDEANTTDALGMIKEVMVDRRVNGRKITAKRLQFIAACNPYRKHTEEMIHKLESAGLGYHVATQQTRDRLGRIPLRHLVYRVHSLPASMRPLVWDFGQLKPEVEQLYTFQIVHRFVLQENQIPGDLQLVKALTAVLTASQRFMRDQESWSHRMNPFNEISQGVLSKTFSCVYIRGQSGQDECSFVSLRDVERAMKVMVWFYNHRDALDHLMDYTLIDSDEESDDDGAGENGLDNEDSPLDQPIDEITRALVLSLGVCYQARLQNREPFRRAVAPSFSPPCLLPGGHERILQEITRCQKAVLGELELGQNIARNTALSENVFMMVVCIELRIPLFVVGKPGSSKSLAKTVVADNMEGDASKSDLFKTFKQVHMVSYQCSPLSTAEGIKATFRQCSQLQKANNPDKFVSVVVLDEVGLAEDSPLMPLKTLHPLLEDGVSSTDDILEVEEQTREKVAFIGISNWALDPAKMNRGIMLTRGVPDTEELVDSAMGICSTDDRVQSFVEPLMEPLARGYEKLYKSQRKSEALIKSKKDEFFGLRDFYSLVKMVYKIAEELDREPAWKEIERAIRRSFGGLDDIDPVKFFGKQFPQARRLMRRQEPDPDAFSAVNLIKASLERQITRGESRYLLVLTENYAALSIVLQELHEGEEPIVIFGSSFPKDQEFTQVCRDINRIKVCMETGRTVILLNLESLYESLYDALNQYYVYFGGQKYVDLGLGSHRVKCRVADKFRLIVIAERDVVYSKFPIPLINRLEKHYLVTSTSLSPQQQNIVGRIREWVLKFSTVDIPRHQQMRAYTPGDSFVGYHDDTAASVVLQVTKNLSEDGRREYDDEEEVFRQSQELLLQCATPDAVARLPCTKLAQQAAMLWSTYFTTQEHSSLTAFLKNVLTIEERAEEDVGCLIQWQTVPQNCATIAKAAFVVVCAWLRSIYLIHRVSQAITRNAMAKFGAAIFRDFLAKLGGREGLLIVQCNAGDVNSNLIPCARHLLVDERACAIEDFKKTVGHDQSLVHIVMIVQLPRLVGGCQTFAGFQGGRWISVHIDELRPPIGQIPAIEFMVDRSISELFDVAPSTTHSEEMEVAIEEQEQIDIEMETSDHAANERVLDKVNIISLLRSCIQAAVARIDEESRLSSRSTRRIEVMLNLLPDDRSEKTDLSFATILARRIHRLLQEKDERAGTKASDWLRSEALSGTGIQESGTFRKALWQRVYSSVIPILSEVIAVVDRDSNLELVSEESTWLSRLWIAFFQDQTLVELHYDNFLSLESGIIRERAPVTTSGHERHIFDVQFPFSWLIKERIDAMWKEATSISARTNTPVQQCLRDLIRTSEIGNLIEEAQQEGYGEAAILRYLHDFVHMVHKPTVPDGEEELISQAIITAARELHAQSHSLEDFSLSIPVIHVAHEAIEKRLSNLSHLIKCQPDIVTNLLRAVPPRESEMVYDAVALKLCLSTLTPNPGEFDDPQTRLVWCNRVLAVRSSAENLLNSSTPYGEKTTFVLRDCRSIWQRASAVRLFIEHTCPGTLPCHPADVKNAFKLWKALGDETDFSKPDTIRVIEKFLVDCSEAVSKRYTSYGVTTCPVCLEGLAEKDPVRLPCNHVVCLPCISNWVEQERKCPVCKQDIPENFRITSTKAVRRAVQTHFDFRRRCNSFFMDLVSLFCFGAEAGVIDSDLFSMFMSYVLEGRSKTKAFSPFPEHGIDATPVVRSFLLQQLLRNSDEEVKEHLSHYLSEARELRPDNGHLLQVCQLFVHCWEDSLISQFAKLSDNLPALIKVTQQLCLECSPALTSSRSEPDREVDVALLENVAKGRYVLGVTAEFMNLMAEKGTLDDMRITTEMLSLFEAVKTMCCKSTTVRLYLLKQLARRFGVEVIQTLCERKELDWIVPLESRTQQEEDLVPDRFIIYGENYKKIREAVAKTVLSGSHRELTATLEADALPPVVREVMLLLAEYREVTTCYRFTNAERRLSTRGHKVLEEFFQGGANLTDRARSLAVHLLNNTLGPPMMPSTRASPGRSAMEQNLAELVIHTVTVLQCINHVTVCEPLRLMMENPAALRNTFFPTMPEDNLEEAMAGMRETGSWYQCPKGHPYYIGDCGRPVEVKVCPECKVKIGGTGYNLSTGNTVAQRADRTMTGHVLGHPTTRPRNLAPERNLSSVVVGITRILMHCALIEGANRQLQDVSTLMNPTVPPAALSLFLWNHLQLDVEVLAKSLGRSVEETILCVHMILAYMTGHVSNLQQPMIPAPNLTSKESRKDWEMAFSSSVVTPTLTNLEIQIQHCLGLMVGDNRLVTFVIINTFLHTDILIRIFPGNNPLMRQLYEVDVPADSLTGGILPSCPALWRYRTQVTLDHFSHTFQQEVFSTDNGRNKVLAEFLQQEHKLRALRFLPDIVKLQRFLMDQFHRRIDRTEAEKIKIRDFLRKNVSSKSARDELASLIASFNKAWNLVRLNLDQEGRLRPPSDLCQIPMDSTRPLAVLLPNASGMGICSLALVSYLTTVHNDFNRRYQHLVGGNAKDLTIIPLQDVTPSQLISYDAERDLLPLILAQCNYSLEVGKGTLVQYNWDALERQLIDRFIRGRPLIEFKDERFAFSRDIQLDSVFAAVKVKVPQHPLNSTVCRQIITEIRSLTDICDVLSSLDIAIGFLSSTGGKLDMLLEEYLRKVLRMAQQNCLRSLKAQQCCQLRHVVSLWRLLSVERARILMRRGQDPFELIPNTYKDVIPNREMMKLSDAMKRIDLDSFVGEVLELILLNLRMEPIPGEEEMRYKLVLTINVFKTIGVFECLGDFIQWHLDNKGHDAIQGLDQWPDSVKLKHVIAAWRTSVELCDSYYDKREAASA